MNTQTRNNEKGFTMVELIIVVAIMGIIGALLVPSFLEMSRKAKLTTDVSTVKTLQRTIDAYNAQPQTTYIDSQDTTVIESLLSDAKLLSSKVELQTGGTVKTVGGRVRLNLTSGSVEQSIIDMANGLNSTDQMRNWIAVGGTNLSTTGATSTPSPSGSSS